MSEPRSTAPISVAAIFAVILGAAALVLIPVASGMHPFALILALAAVLLGVVAALNGRGGPASSRWIAIAGVGLGVIAAVIVGIITLG